MSEVLNQYNSLAGKCSSKLDTSPASQIIEKMYELAGVEKLCTHTIINPERCNHRRMTRCCGCDWLKLPSFTAEKQLSLIKWLSKRCFYIEISEMMNKSYGIAFKYQPADEYKNEQSECCVNKNFTEALAESINYIWRDLTDQERTEIADILRG